jgi:hypothetical protein
MYINYKMRKLVPTIDGDWACDTYTLGYNSQKQIIFLFYFFGDSYQTLMVNEKKVDYFKK